MRRFGVGIVALALVAACGGKPPGPAADPALPAMPDGHPPVTELAAAHSPTLPPGTVLAIVGKDAVTAGELDAAIDAMPSPDRLEYTTAENIRELVESLVDRKLMAAAARAEGLDRDPIMREMLGEPEQGSGLNAEQMLAGVWLETELGKAPPPAEAVVTRYYREHAAEFTEPARVRVTRVVAADEVAAGRLRGELSRGATLDQLNALVPDEAASVEQLWLQDVAKKPEMTSIALGLKPREVSPVLPAANGYAVLRAEEVVPARARPLDEVREGIRASLQDAVRREAMAGIRDRLREGVQVAIDEGRLASYLPPPAGAP